MRLTTEAYFSKPMMKTLTFLYGAKEARAARRLMTPIIERAREAEAAGRIADMWPSLMGDTADEIRAGKLTLTIIYRRVTDGTKGPREKWSTPILHAETNDNDRDPQTQERASVEG